MDKAKLTNLIYKYAVECQRDIGMKESVRKELMDELDYLEQDWQWREMSYERIGDENVKLHEFLEWVALGEGEPADRAHGIMRDKDRHLQKPKSPRSPELTGDE